MFTQYRYYKHKAFRDVCIKVIKVSYSCKDYVKMKIEYVVIGNSGEPRKLVEKRNYVVTADDFKDWSLIEIDGLKDLKDWVLVTDEEVREE